MTDRKPKVPYDVKKEEVETEGYVVKYHDEKGKYKNTSRVFTTKDKADAHAERGNRITRVGGKYSVHQVNDKGHEVKEAFEIKDKEAETSYNTHDDMMKNVDRAKLKTVVAGLLKDMSDRERKVIHARFWENKPLAKVAKEMNVSPERIRQIEARVLRKLKSPINAKKLSAFREESQIDEVSSALLYRAKQAAQKKAGWLMPGDKGKGDKAWNRVKKFRDAGVEKEKQERAAKKVNESFAEQMSTHEPIPLQKRVKRVKSFHVGHSKPMGEAQRVADVKLVKTKLPDGRIVYRKERTTTNVQHEMYTGSEPVSGNRADPANRFVGTNAIRQNYASVTPGQGSVAGEIAVAKFAPEKVDYSSSLIKKTRTEVDQSKENLGQKHLKDIQKALSGIREQTELNESFSAGFELAPFARDYGIQVQSSFTHHPEVQEALDAQEDAMNEAIYQGRDVPLNKPMKGDVKKSKVYVRDPSTGNIKKVNFGDKKLSIKKDQPGRKRSYCARSSGQGNLTKKTSANYWSRRAWDC